MIYSITIKANLTLKISEKIKRELTGVGQGLDSGRLQVAETHFSLLDLDGPTKRDLPLHPVSLYPVKLSSLLSCEGQ